jgi:hypothetical protein
MKQAQSFDWQQHAAAEQLCLDLLAGFRQENTALARFEEQLRERASCRLLDGIDHLLLHDSPALQERLSVCGFVRSAESAVWQHPGALLPRLVFGEPSGAKAGVALRVESIADFLQAHNLSAEIEGGVLSPYRRAPLGEEGGVALLVVERRGSDGYEPITPPPGYVEGVVSALELWQSRPRSAADEDAALADALQRAENIADRLGVDLAAHIVCQGERSYWLTRNFAGRLQKSRQDALGLGWANHDHHTFRSSRRNFSRLVTLFSRLGFRHRERFYAGDEAGWGAQLMENPVAGLTLFLDVDLAPEEIATDFSREELPERAQLGTVGMWCALHGDSILGGGMHHLAAQFDFERLMRDLAGHGVAYMAPFSNFPYLKQAFSVAERWPVDPVRLDRLMREGVVSNEQGDRFLAGGAIGSHLEDIERGQGYKGFNKSNVSVIIRETDPRK